MVSRTKRMKHALSVVMYRTGFSWCVCVKSRICIRATHSCISAEKPKGHAPNHTRLNNPAVSSRTADCPTPGLLLGKLG